MPPLTRDRFVSNAMWMSLGFASQRVAAVPSLYRGNFRAGAASCSNNQGDDFWAFWDELGAVMLVREHTGWTGEPLFLAPPPDALHALVERALGEASMPKKGAWILGEMSSPLRPRHPADGTDFTALIDAFFGPSLLESYGPRSPVERRLFDALARDEVTIPRDLGLALLCSNSVKEWLEAGEPARTKAEQIAQGLAPLGFIWPDFEQHLAEASRHMI